MKMILISASLIFALMVIHYSLILKRRKQNPEDFKLFDRSTQNFKNLEGWLPYITMAIAINFFDTDFFMEKYRSITNSEVLLFLIPVFFASIVFFLPNIIFAITHKQKK